MSDSSDSPCASKSAESENFDSPNSTVTVPKLSVFNAQNTFAIPTIPASPFSSINAADFGKFSAFSGTAVFFPTGMFPALMPFHQHPPLITENKRPRIDDSSVASSSEEPDISSQLKEFRDSLVTGLQENLQRLSVLDRLVNTVTSKAHLLQPLKPLLSELASLRAALDDLLAFHVQANAALEAEIHSQLRPVLQQFKLISQSIEDSNLLPPESKHLNELALLLTKNKELGRELNTLRGALSSIQATNHASLEALKTTQLQHDNLIARLSELLRVNADDRIIVQELSRMLDERSVFHNRLRESTDSVKDAIVTISDLKSEVQSLPRTSLAVESIVAEVSQVILDCFSHFICPVTSNDTSLAKFDLVENRLAELTSQQDRLAHCALNNHLNWQSKFSTLSATCAQLKAQVQSLTTETSSLRAQLQASKRTASQLSVDLESAHQRISTLESALSAKNQDYRAKEIDVLRLQGELEDSELKHRHAMATLERKIAALEMKLEEETRQQRLSAVNDDRLSGVQQKKRESSSGSSGSSSGSINSDILGIFQGSKSKLCHNAATVPASVANTSVDEIPATFQQPQPQPQSKPKLFAFTGIRPDPAPFLKIIADLGGGFCGGVNFSEDLTHVLAPPGYISIRVLGAALSGKWIVPPRWLEACAAHGRWVPEYEHGGFLYAGPKPFRLKTIWMSDQFATQHARHKSFQTESLRALLTKLGKARFTERPEDAEILLVSEVEEEMFAGYLEKEVLTLSALISKIPLPPR